MTDFASSVRLPEAFLRAVQHRESRSGGGPALLAPTLPTIALSREAGARGTSVAREIGRRLDWPVYDHELVQAIAQEMHIHTSLLESVDERHKDWLQERVEALCNVPAVSEAAFVRRLVKSLLSLAAHGKCIIVGRGAPHVLPASSTLRVRLVAALEDRITVLVQELGLSREQAAQHVEETDRQRARFIKEHFFADAADPLNYDLVLNTSRWSVGECAELVIDALHKRQARAAPAS